ncbi:hypothetical protein K3G39_01295 [Pontibacter sp. HSC-14F20]|uniref:hypothetical protein n=1 Tax=Pontibacter sp. HSC-14F20 TaxID=2864136 RepID=UPI001C735057|nr:hypothetical protein [Pontibacter sp. HSC-14F20]MBX0331865.1 hypothetical protein [Pontibacter sp. HSC-14F20]
MMSIALLWVVLLQSTQTYAFDTTQLVQHNQAGIAQDETVSSDNSVTGLQSGMLYLAEEGTAATLTFNLQPAATVFRTQLIRFTRQKAVPPYAARAPGDNFFCQFFYTSSQPQAP